MINKIFGLLAAAVLTFSFPAAPKVHEITNFNQAKAAAVKINRDAPGTFYCGCRINWQGKKGVEATVLSAQREDRESPLHLHLGEVMSGGEKMEFTIQKSIELGVNVLTPLFSAASIAWRRSAPR